MKAAGIHAGFSTVLERPVVGTLALEAGFDGGKVSAIASEQDNPRARSRIAVRGSIG